MMSREESKDGKFEIIHKQKSEDSYFCSDTDDNWWIISSKEKVELFHFFGQFYQRSSGDFKEGIMSVSFSSDGNYIQVEDYKKNIENHELPKEIIVLKSKEEITLVYENGRQETKKLIFH